jgi:hypothetical protein
MDEAMMMYNIKEVFYLLDNVSWCDDRKDKIIKKLLEDFRELNDYMYNCLDANPIDGFTSNYERDFNKKEC